MSMSTTPSQIPPVNFQGYGITKNADDTGYLVFRQGIQVAGPFDKSALENWLEVNKDPDKFDMQCMRNIMTECMYPERVKK